MGRRSECGFGGFRDVSVASTRLCAESSCNSFLDEIRFYGLGLVSMALGGLVCWLAKRWWNRTLVLLGAIGVSLLVPPLMHAQGRWAVPLENGATCFVRAGASKDDIRQTCGTPTYWCTGPKRVDSSNWNLASVVVCGYRGDVYGNRFVAYDCQGRVDTVTMFAVGPPTESLPPHCVNWGR